jgi:hypothetical protein
MESTLVCGESNNGHCQTRNDDPWSEAHGMEHSYGVGRGVNTVGNLSALSNGVAPHPRRNHQSAQNPIPENFLRRPPPSAP